MNKRQARILALEYAAQLLRGPIQEAELAGEVGRALSFLNEEKVKLQMRILANQLADRAGKIKHNYYRGRKQ